MKEVVKQFLKKPLGMLALIVILIFCFVGVYAPFFASSKPLFVQYDGVGYFPLFRYLLYSGFYTKNLDLFFNIMIFTLPLLLLTRNLWIFLALQFGVFIYLLFFPLQDPAIDKSLLEKQRSALLGGGNLDNLEFQNNYAKLNSVLRYQQLQEQSERLLPYATPYEDYAKRKWLEQEVRDKKSELTRKGVGLAELPSDKILEDEILKQTSPQDLKRIVALPILVNLTQESSQLAWLKQESKKIKYKVMPLFRPFHWEDDAGGQQALNQYIPWWELTRVGRKDLVAALIFGIRISLVVGILSVGLALAIGVPIGAFAGYYGGTFDIFVSRLLEIWESMPVFFMLLLVVAMTQSKSIFIVIAVIGLFSWPSFSRYIRGEFFKQKGLAYVEACRSQGFSDSYIMFSHILPNAVPPLLTLLPFAVMGAITAEAGLSFLGLGEEGSGSWGVLMDEGRSAFPGEAYLLWPPAILLTILLIAIALVGDALRDALDPKLRRSD